MNNSYQLYNDLAWLPAPELVQILADVLPIVRTCQSNRGASQIR
jgi:hypothetical protein